jgi:hypothetical protein
MFANRAVQLAELGVGVVDRLKGNKIDGDKVLGMKRAFYSFD